MATEAERLATLEAQVEAHEKVIATVCADIKEIKERLLGRPSWFVVLVISSLLTAASAMAMYILTLPHL